MPNHSTSLSALAAPTAPTTLTTHEAHGATLYPSLPITNEDETVPTEEPAKGKYTTSQDSKDFTLSVSSVNYCGKEGSENIFEFYSDDLDDNENFQKACQMFSTLTYSELKALVKNANLISILSHIVLTEADTNRSIVELVKEEKIHWGADNKAPNRPNAILTSSIRRKSPTEDELNEWYTTGIQEFTADLESEASNYTGGNVNLVISGLLVYDLLCNHVYQSCNLGSVRSERARLTDSDELEYQTSKFNYNDNNFLSGKFIKTPIFFFW